MYCLFRKIRACLLHRTNKLFLLFFITAFSVFAQDDARLYNEIVSQIDDSGIFDEQLCLRLLDATGNNKARQAMFVNKLRSHYCETYFKSNSQRIIPLEMFCNDYFGKNARLGYFIFLTTREIFNPFTQSEFEYFADIAKKSDNTNNYGELNYAVDLYNGLILYAKSHLDKSDYADVAKYLTRALSYKDSDIHYEKLKNSLVKTHMYETLFENELYRYYDRKDGSIKDELANYLLYKKITNPKYSFKEYCNIIKSQLFDKIHMSFQISPANNPVFLLQNSSGSSISLDLSKDSPASNQNRLFVFFSVTCGNCIKEMNVLSEMTSYLAEKNIVITAVYTMYNHRETAVTELQSFNDKHHYPFEKFADEHNKIYEFFDFNHVPYLVFYNGNTHTFVKGSFEHYGNIRGKFEYLINKLYN